jgi:hypothetical protein
MASDSPTPRVRISRRYAVAAKASRSVALGFALLVASLSVACATGSSDTSSSQSRSRFDTITREQLASIEQTENISLYDAIRRIHPSWLRGRGTATPVVVHFNGARIGDTRELRTFRVSDVQYVEHMEGPQATQRFGTGYGAGVLLVYGRAGT